MKTIIAHDRCVLLCGDCTELGAVLPENSVDAIVTDPPAGIGFMGKGWDRDKGGRDIWIDWFRGAIAPAFKALKPGGHALVWALPRTSHWTATALENAGFEVRDVVMHLFGTGFPKSMNIGKAIDKALGAERPVVGSKVYKATNGNDFGEYATGPQDVTGAGSPQAAQYEGFGTALKPAAEHWILARKPITGTVAGNVLQHGTGGLNIDGCRIGDEQRSNPAAGNKPGGASYMMSEVGMPDGVAPTTCTGRWPANVVLSHHEHCVTEERPGLIETTQSFCVPECPVRQLDAQAGTSKSTQGKPRSGRAGEGYGMTHTGAEYSDSGGPSRFFYVTKPSKKEKNAGCDHLAAKSGGEATGRVDGSAGTQNPRAGAGRTGGARNFHPTVKSIELMRWLIRLITPPGGTVLDPFAGSGTTGVAALAEGFSFFGCEEGGDGEEYIPIIKARLEHALG